MSISHHELTGFILTHCPGARAVQPHSALEGATTMISV